MAAGLNCVPEESHLSGHLLPAVVVVSGFMTVQAAIMPSRWAASGSRSGGMVSAWQWHGSLTGNAASALDQALAKWLKGLMAARTHPGLAAVDGCQGSTDRQGWHAEL